MRKHIVWAATMAVGLFAVTVQADDESDRPALRREGAGKYWIGVQTAPVDEALRSHLLLDESLMIGQVLPDSPAEKAGLKQFDIVLRFGGRRVSNLDDLVQAVAENADREVRVTILREGKKKELEVQPAERPEGFVFPGDVQEFPAPLARWFDLGRPEDGTLRLWALGPAMIDGVDRALKGDISIEIKRDEGQPAKITIKHNDKTWEVTEEELNKLPEDLLFHAERLLGRGPVVMGRRTLRDSEDKEETIRLLSPEEVRLEEAVRQLEQLQERLSNEDPLKALRKDVEALQIELQRLRAELDEEDRDE